VDLWEETNHNPVMMLGRISQERLDEVSHDDGFKSHLKRVYEHLHNYKSEKLWYQKHHKDNRSHSI